MTKKIDELKTELTDKAIEKVVEVAKKAENLIEEKVVKPLEGRLQHDRNIKP